MPGMPKCDDCKIEMVLVPDYPLKHIFMNTKIWAHLTCPKCGNGLHIPIKPKDVELIEELYKHGL